MRADARGYRARCVELAAGGIAPKEIASALGLNVATVRRHLRAARDEVQQLRAERLQALTNRALADAAEALATVRAAMGDEDAPWPARVNAAAKTLDAALRLWQASDIEARLQCLEEALRERTTHIP